MNVRIERMNPRHLKLLDKNARYMKPETFQRLVENVKRDGKLTSVPFAARMEDGSYEVLSGNHRVAAAIKAELDIIDVMVTDDVLTKSERIAIQLSHNSLVGEDDPALLKELWDSIGQVDMKLYAGLDDLKMQSIEAKSVPALSAPDIDFQIVTLLLLPEETERMKKILETMKNGADETWLARYQDADRLFDALADTSSAHKVYNTATALGLMLDLEEAHIGDLREAWQQEEERKEWVPLSSVIGERKIPPEAAQIIATAIDKMIDTGLVTSKARWKALEYWAADQLAGSSKAA